MKNYLARLALPRKATDDEVHDAISQAVDHPQESEWVQDANTIMSEKVTRTYYERTHLQYDAINAALDCLRQANAVDSHRWNERLVDFEIDTDNLNDR